MEQRDAIRALDAATGGRVGLRSAVGAAMPTMAGHFAVFNTWTEIDSIYEGRFMERIAPGAFKKTIRENGQDVRVLLNHGSDPSVGNKPLGAPEVLREDELGAYYEVPLFDTSYNRDLIPALEASQYGASFRFRVMREDIVDSPEASDANPYGLPERTIREARLYEFGPVTFPAYAAATAGIRSVTDLDILRRFAQADPERVAGLIDVLRAETGAPPSEEEEETPVTLDAEQEAHLEEDDDDAARAAHLVDFWFVATPERAGDPFDSRTRRLIRLSR